MHKLAIIAVLGLTGSAVCIGAAAAIGGREFGRNWGGDMDFSMFGDRPRCERVEDATATSRDLEWDGSDHFGLAVPGHASYTPGTDNKVHISGDPQMIAHIRVRDGRLEMNCRNWRGDMDALTITLPGREFKRFSIAGAGNLVLSKLDQTSARFNIAGSGSIKADGKVEHTDLHIAGSGDIDLSQVKANVATVHIAGSGNTDIAPSDEADIHIAGSGDVNLHGNPKKLETHIAGSGRIHNISGG